MPSSIFELPVVGEVTSRARVLGYDLSLSEDNQKAVRSILSETSRLSYVKGVLVPKSGLYLSTGVSFKLSGQNITSEIIAHNVKYEQEGPDCSLVVWLRDFVDGDGFDSVGLLQTRYQVDDFF